VALAPASGPRTAVPEDLPALRRIAAGALRWDADAAALPDLLWPNTDTEFALISEVDGVPVGLAFGSLGREPRDPATARRGHVNLLAVDEAVRRQGQATALLAELERRLRSVGARDLLIGGATPRFAWPWIDVRYTAATCFAEARGYVRQREAVNMTVELEGAAQTGLLATELEEKRLAEHRITVRRMTEADRPGIEAWLATWGGTLREETLATLDHARDWTAGTYLAVRREGTEQAEYVGFANYGVNRRDWFGPMGTADELRGLGIGRVLLRRSLGEMRELGLRTAQIGWVGPIPFYVRTVDAYIERAYWMYRRDR
jgi:GNAT superfamily N-acetyltransferase